MTSPPRPCWCGETDREPLREDYARCVGCGSLLYDRPYRLEDYASPDGETGFYGRSYWSEHVPQVLGLPGLAERARSDTSDRAVYYLRRTLDYVAPGTAVLELGSAPGSFAYLLKEAGFAVEGLEVGNAAIEFVRRTFRLKVHRGPLEERRFLRRFGSIVAIDVLEHLPRPLDTLKACALGLRDGGTLLLQTPCYRGEGADWPMLVPKEHLFLYTAESIRRLLAEAGFEAVEIGASLFPHDMWVAASLEAPLPKRPDPLAGITPVAQALLDAYDERQRLGRELAEVQVDQAHKEELIRRLSRELEDVRGDQARKEELIARISRELVEVRADQAAKELVIARLVRELKDPWTVLRAALRRG
jgi:2-polyprenyl-3-methyl-5-hydroxy-6-metoxy-1,4-benzoquinol methylase